MFFSFQCLDFLIILKQFVTIEIRHNNEIRGITTADSQSTWKIGCLLNKKINNACFMSPNNHSLFSFNTCYHNKVKHVWCIFFTNFMHFYETSFALKNYTVEFFQNDNESGFSTCTVTR